MIINKTESAQSPDLRQQQLQASSQLSRTGSSSCGKVTERMLVAELSKGRDSANELLRYLKQGAVDGINSSSSIKSSPAVAVTAAAAAAALLAEAIEASFSSCISLASSAAAAAAASTTPATRSVVGAKLEDSGESARVPAGATGTRRGCYKRRNKHFESWVKLSPNQMADEHAWRKYGQKVILNANHPRNYYRCTHKNDRGCPATKHVQRISDDPPMYRTTYTAHHTCGHNSPNHITMVIKPVSPSPPTLSDDGSPHDHHSVALLDSQKSTESSSNYLMNLGSNKEASHPLLISSHQQTTNDDQHYYSPAPEQTTGALQEASSGQLEAADSWSSRLGSGSSGSVVDDINGDYVISGVYHPTTVAGSPQSTRCFDIELLVVASVDHPFDEIDSWIRHDDAW